MYKEGTLGKKIMIVGIVIIAILLILGIFFIVKNVNKTVEVTTYEAKTLYVGDKYTIDIKKYYGDKNITYESSNYKVLFINRDTGVAEATDVGGATIIVKKKDDTVTKQKIKVLEKN